MACLRTLFMDLRIISTLMVAWLGVVFFIMTEIGIFENSKFVAFGPRKELSFMHVAVGKPRALNQELTQELKRATRRHAVQVCDAGDAHHHAHAHL